MHEARVSGVAITGVVVSLGVLTVIFVCLCLLLSYPTALLPSGRSFGYAPAPLRPGAGPRRPVKNLMGAFIAESENHDKRPTTRWSFHGSQAPLPFHPRHSHAIAQQGVASDQALRCGPEQCQPRRNLFAGRQRRQDAQSPPLAGSRRGAFRTIMAVLSAHGQNQP